MERQVRKRRILGLVLMMSTVAATAFAWPDTTSKPVEGGAPKPSRKRLPFNPTTVGAPRPFAVALTLEHAKGRSSAPDARTVHAQFHFSQRRSVPMRLRYGTQIVRDDGRIVSERLSDVLRVEGDGDFSQTLVDRLADGYYILRVTGVAKGGGEEMVDENELYLEVKDGSTTQIDDYMQFRQVSAIGAPHVVSTEGVQ
jgi:hypothetical protein